MVDITLRFGTDDSDFVVEQVLRRSSSASQPVTYNASIYDTLCNGLKHVVDKTIPIKQLLPPQQNEEEWLTQFGHSMLL